MDIKGKTVLILGGWGLVGRAIAFSILENQPKRLVLTSLRENEAVEIEEQLCEHHTNVGTEIISEWGDIFVRQEYRYIPRAEVQSNTVMRKNLIADIFDELSPDLLTATAVYNLFTAYNPEIIIDCINTATAVAYQNPYDKIAKVRNAIKNEQIDDAFIYNVEETILSQAVPQLIRHMQILIESMKVAETRFYMKIGTTGTGGMGFNIPYTHSEVKPSRMLLGKSSIAGAHTMMLFLLGRTPNAPIIKEIKPSAAIAWKEIGFGKIMRRGRYIPIYDTDPKTPEPLTGELKPYGKGKWIKKGDDVLESVYIDAGENGYFSMGEFAVITSESQMEFVTPEEIADRAIMEIKGGNTGTDIITALDAAVLGPTYRAALIRQNALEHMLELQDKYEIDSIGFELLGPPRLTKLLYEGYLIYRICGSLENIDQFDNEELSSLAYGIIKTNTQLRTTILSIGTPILMPDGKSYIRGPEISEPNFEGVDSIVITPELIEEWAANAWVDLRANCFEEWRKRIKKLQSDMQEIAEKEHSSYFYRKRKFLLQGDIIDISRTVSWIFETEDEGFRIK
ncbi:MAG: short-chain dehydrogenase [Candidatus Marinimicrobia bacterium]|nr:short-chain dehydrogenase [Candidatus Neomarinimicrobiota bacterium]